MFSEKSLHPVKGDDLFSVIQVGVDRAGDEQQFFVDGKGAALDHSGEGAAIDGATQNTFIPPTDKDGYFSYHCRITASYVGGRTLTLTPEQEQTVRAWAGRA